MPPSSLFKRDIHLSAFKETTLVGCIRASLYHSDALLANAMTPGNWRKVLLTFCVPYCVPYCVS